MYISGSIFIEQTNMNTPSATVSSLAPVSQAVPVFLATAPSITSVSPQNIYSTLNHTDDRGMNRRGKPNAILPPVMMFAIYFFINWISTGMRLTHYGELPHKNNSP